MNLSDKSNKDETDKSVPYWFYVEEDIKKFIKKIKFNLVGNIGEDMDMIDKEAGEKLVKGFKFKGSVNNTCANDQLKRREK